VLTIVSGISTVAFVTSNNVNLAFAAKKHGSSSDNGGGSGSSDNGGGSGSDNGGGSSDNGGGTTASGGSDNSNSGSSGAASSTSPTPPPPAAQQTCPDGSTPDFNGNCPTTTPPTNEATPLSTPAPAAPIGNETGTALSGGTTPSAAPTTNTPTLTPPTNTPTLTPSPQDLPIEGTPAQRAAAAAQSPTPLVSPNPDGSCPAGSHKYSSFGFCASDNPPPAPNTPAPGAPIAIPTTQPDPIIHTCPPGYTKFGDKCVLNIQCPSGYTKIGDQCLTPAQPAGADAARAAEAARCGSPAGAADAAAQAASGVGCPNADGSCPPSAPILWEGRCVDKLPVLPGSNTGTGGGFIQMLPTKPQPQAAPPASTPPATPPTVCPPTQHYDTSQQKCVDG